MYNLLLCVGKGMVSRDAIDATLTAYNNACADMRSKARDNLISIFSDGGEELHETDFHYLQIMDSDGEWHCGKRVCTSN